MASVEALEAVVLLSIDMIGSTPSEVGTVDAQTTLTPSQVRQAYGVNQLPANLNGQDTAIAILDPLKDSNIYNNLV